jgi:hypothetical protein
MTPTAVEGAGGAVGERVKLAKGHYVMLRDQVKDVVEDELVLLRSPKASEGSGGALGEAVALERGNTVGVRDQVMDLVAGQGLKVSRASSNLMPTPRANEPGSTSVGYGDCLNDVANRIVNGFAPKDLMPTPTVRDFKDGQAEHRRDGVVQTDTVARAVFNSGEVSLLGTPRATASESSAVQVDLGAPKSRIEDQVLVTDWGKFTAAIRRWEALTRPAPAPTKPDGRDGNHRLSAEFTEWMMGLPAGWITAEDIGLKRNDQLKACGNGVVPQQAELALRMLLQDVQVESVIRGGLSSVLPTPTVMDRRDGKHMRAVAIENLSRGKNRGLGLNNVVEVVGVDWADGDTFEMVDGKLEKRTNTNEETI